MTDDWTDMEAIVRTVPKARSSISVLAKGVVKLSISFSESFFMDLGRPKRATVQLGSGANLGKVRIVAGKEGKLEVKEMGLGGGRITMACPKELGEADRTAETCEFEMIGDSEKGKVAVFALPIKAWKNQVPDVVPLTDSKQARAAQVNGASQKVNVVEYLTTKGVRGVKREGDGWRIAGQLESKFSTLTIVNRYRSAAELPLVNAVDLV